MSLSNIKRLAGRLIVLGILLVGLVVLPMNPVEKKAYAATPCEECYSAYEACMAQCVDYQSACVTFCEFQLNRCERNCW